MPDAVCNVSLDGMGTVHVDDIVSTQPSEHIHHAAFLGRTLHMRGVGHLSELFRHPRSRHLHHLGKDAVRILKQFVGLIEFLDFTRIKYLPQKKTRELNHLVKLQKFYLKSRFLQS